MTGAVDSLLAEVLDRMAARDGWGGAAYRGGCALAAAALGCDEAVLREGLIGLAGEACFARVVQAPDDPRRFALAAAAGEGEPALLARLPLDASVSGWDADDVLAVSLTRRRFWRLTGARAWVGDPDRVLRGDVLLLRQDPRGFLALAAVAQAAARRAERAGREAYEHVMTPARAEILAPTWASLVLDPLKTMRTPNDPAGGSIFWPAFRAALAAKTAATARAANLHPARPPDGALILDPAAMDWTRRGLLKGVETIDILDAPATGALGQALRRLNPLIGGSRGVGLVGLEAQARRRAA